jgi:class 3 adenylate cyclase
MATDIVGYSRLIDADEAATLSSIKTLRADVVDPILTEHKGRIVKLMGDGALVEFNSVVDAIACAIAMQKGVAVHQAGSHPDRRIVFRIGINLGDGGGRRGRSLRPRHERPGAAGAALAAWRRAHSLGG